MKIIQLLFTILISSMLNISANAHIKDTLAVVEHTSKWQNFMDELRCNPSFMHNAYQSSMTEMGLRICNRNSNKAMLMETGNGHTLGGAYVVSYLRLDEANTVWGGASYQVGRKRNIQFNSTSDYELLYPYVMADTIGGDMENERYTFSGGYAVNMKRWTLGATLDFRAEHEFRTTDPRPRGIITDLALRVGVNYALTNYKMGAGVGVKTYKQTNDVDFYNPLGVIPTYHMTGLGSNYVRFAGAVRSAYYKGTGFIADLQLASSCGTGLYVLMEGSFMPYEKILTKLNALPISTLEVTNATMKVGWKHEGTTGWATVAGIDLERRNGNEHIAGNSSSTEYQSLITLSMFSDNVYDYYVGGNVNVGSRKQITLNTRFGFIDNLARYVELKREMAYTKTYGKLDWQWIWYNKAQWLVEWSGDVAYYHNNSKRMVMPYSWIEGRIIELVNHTYESKTADLWTFGTQIRVWHYPKNWRNIGVFMTTGMQFLNTSNIKQTTLNTSVGITF